MEKIKRFKIIWQLILAVILIALGIVTIILSRDVTYWKVIGYVTGALLAIDGVFRLIIYFLNNEVNIAKLNVSICIGEITLAVFICIKASIVIEYYTLLIAILLTVLGFVALVDSIIKIAKKSERVSIIVMTIVFSLILLALGIIALAFYPYTGPQSGNVNTISIMLIITGILFILGAIGLIIYTIVKAKKDKKLQREENEEIARSREEKRTRK